MEFSSWFQSAIQQRLDNVSRLIERHPDIQKLRVEEKLAFDALHFGVGKPRQSEFMEWEGKHNFKLAMEKERLYLQGLKDGAQLVFSLLEYHVVSGDEAAVAGSPPQKSDQ